MAFRSGFGYSKGVAKLIFQNKYFSGSSWVVLAIPKGVAKIAISKSIVYIAFWLREEGAITPTGIYLSKLWL